MTSSHKKKDIVLYMNASITGYLITRHSAPDGQILDWVSNASYRRSFIGTVWTPGFSMGGTMLSRHLPSCWHLLPSHVNEPAGFVKYLMFFTDEESNNEKDLMLTAG
jgi:hypothetical protein